MDNIGHEKKITLRQYLYIYLVFFFSPGIRYINIATITEAKQAAWLTPAVSFAAVLLLVIIVKQLMVKFAGLSYHDMLCKVFGKIAGKFITVLLIIWLIILLASYYRYAADKLVSSIYTGTDENLFIGLGIISIAYLLYYGIATIGRISKIIYFIILFQFLLLLVLVIPNMDIKRMTPVSGMDALPLLKSSMHFVGIYIYSTLCLMFSEQIVIDKNNKNSLLIIPFFALTLGTAAIIMVLGTFGSELAGQLNYPFLVLVKSLHTLKMEVDIEALLLSVWILAEYILLAVLTYCILRLLKGLFGLRSPLPFLGVFMFFIYYFNQYLCSEIFELVYLSKNVIIPLNLIFGYGLPAILLITAKARKLA